MNEVPDSDSEGDFLLPPRAGRNGSRGMTNGHKLALHENDDDDEDGDVHDEDWDVIDFNGSGSTGSNSPRSREGPGKPTPSDVSSMSKRKQKVVASPEPERRRTTRFNGVNPYNFDTKFHKDYDPQLKPGAAATKRAQAGQLKRALSLDFDSTTDTPSLKRFRASRPPVTETGRKQEKIQAREDKTTLKEQSDQGKASTHYGSRRSPRVTYNVEMAMKYDMGLQFEKLQKPGVFAKRLEKKRRSLALNLPKYSDPGSGAGSIATTGGRKSLELQQEKSTNNRAGSDTEVYTTDERPSAEPTETRPKSPSQHLAFNANILAIETSPEASSFQTADEHQFLQESLRNLPSVQPLLNGVNPYLKTSATDWDELRHFDRRLFLLQQGAPIKGDNMPYDWSAVKRILFKEGFSINQDFFDGVKDAQYLQRRYECVRIGLEAFFNAKPETENRMEWTLFRVEDFDVYDLKRGHDYWKCTEDGIAKPIETTLENYLPSVANLNVSPERNGTLKPANGLLRGIENYSAEDEMIKEGSITDTQVNRFLALAEPYQANDILLATVQKRQSIDSSMTIRDDKEECALFGDQVSHDQSMQTLVGLMGIAQPAMSQDVDTFGMADIDALLEEVRSSQEDKSQALKRSPIDAASERLSVGFIRRRKRNTAVDFFIFEDDSANEAQPLKDHLNRLDLPVENMNSQELFHSSQDRQHSTSSHRGLQ